MFIVVLLFVALKIPHLYYPFYWDESWPYASAINTMYINGPSLMPGSIDGELSRGHPLMFHFLTSLWMKIFGTSHFVMHSFPLLMSVMFLILVYEVGYRMFDYVSAVTALFLIAFQQIFFVQSSFVLIELFLSLMAFASIYFYVTRKYLLLSLSLIVLYYTKESSLILGIVLGIDALFSFLSKSMPARAKFLLACSLVLPIALIGVFFVLQKKINGWYVLPFQTENTVTDWVGFYSGFAENIRILFYQDCRYLIYLVLLLLLIYSLVKTKNRIYGVFIFMGCIITMIVNNYYGLLPDYALMICFLYGFLLTSLIVARQISAGDGVKYKFILLSLFFLFSFLLFSSYYAYVIPRYLLIVLVPLLFVTALFLVKIARELNLKFLLPVIITVVLSIECYGYIHDNNLGDRSLGAFDGMYVQQEMMKYMDKYDYYDDYISVYSFLQSVHLKDSSTGYKRSAKPCTRVVWGVNDSSDVVMLDNIEADRTAESNQRKKDTSFVLAHHVRKGKAWGEIFVRKRIFKQ